jgi:hypothetical protein
MVFAVGVLTERRGLPEQNAGHTNARLIFVSTREFAFRCIAAARAILQHQPEQTRVCYRTFLRAGAHIFVTRPSGRLFRNQPH